MLASLPKKTSGYKHLPFFVPAVLNEQLDDLKPIFERLFQASSLEKA